MIGWYNVLPSGMKLDASMGMPIPRLAYIPSLNSQAALLTIFSLMTAADWWLVSVNQLWLVNNYLVISLCQHQLLEDWTVLFSQSSSHNLVPDNHTIIEIGQPRVVIGQDQSCYLNDSLNVDAGDVNVFRRNVSNINNLLHLSYRDLACDWSD